MQIIKVWEVSSGFGNVPNNVVLDEYYTEAARERPGSAYDKSYMIELPDKFTLGENICGEKGIWYGRDHVELASVNHEKKHVTGVSIRGFHHFKIVDEQ